MYVFKDVSMIMEHLTEKNYEVIEHRFSLLVSETMR